jgi:transposase
MITMIKKSVNEIFKILKVTHKDVYCKLAKRIRISEYQRSKLNQDMPGRFDMEKRKIKLVQIVKEAKIVLRYVNKIWGTKELRDKVDMLKQILLDNIKTKYGKPVEMERNERPKDIIVSPVDPDARFGAKSRTRHFVGYKANLTETVKSRFITNIKPMPGNMHDGSQTVEMVLEQFEHKLTPKKLIGDAAYTVGEKRKLLKEYGTQVVAPLYEKTGRAQHIFPKNMFKYNPEKAELTCPNGVTTKRSWYDRRHDTITYHFPVYECEICDLQDKCTNSWEARRTVGITSWHDVLLETEKYNRTKQFKKEMKLRQPIEGTNSEMKRYHGLTRARYRGIQKFGLQCYFTAAAVNIKRWMYMILEKIKPKKAVPLPT